MQRWGRYSSPTINSRGRILQDLANSKHEASSWQDTAIDRVTPALREMAENLETNIEELNRNQSRIHMSPYKDYAVANADLATDPSQTISDFVNYGQARANYENLGKKLAIPSYWTL